jgi:hypothetical protein
MDDCGHEHPKVPNVRCIRPVGHRAQPGEYPAIVRWHFGVDPNGVEYVWEPTREEMMTYAQTP